MLHLILNKYAYGQEFKSIFFQKDTINTYLCSSIRSLSFWQIIGPVWYYNRKLLNNWLLGVAVLFWQWVSLVFYSYWTKFCSNVNLQLDKFWLFPAWCGNHGPSIIKDSLVSIKWNNKIFYIKLILAMFASLGRPYDRTSKCNVKDKIPIHIQWSLTYPDTLIQIIHLSGNMFRNQL